MNPKRCTPGILHMLGGLKGGEINNRTALMNQPNCSTAYPAGNGDGEG